MKKICVICKKEFEVKGARKKTAKYCSAKCMGKDYSKKRKGYRHTEETKKKIFIKHLGMSHPNYSRKKENNPMWRGGIRHHSSGYIQTLCHSHPYSDKKGYCLEHRLVMEKHIGRVLLPTEVVHHINGIKDDNRIENLMLFDKSEEHTRWHHEQNRRNKK